MTVAAIVQDLDNCPTCRERPSGLCEKEACRRAILPQLAQNVGWLKLIGNALTEQTKRQTQRLTPTEKAKVAAIGRRNARKVARSKRGGYFGLAKAIAEKGLSL